MTTNNISSKRLICNMPEYNKEGCMGDCIKYVNDEFKICIYLLLDDEEVLL